MTLSQRLSPMNAMALLGICLLPSCGGGDSPTTPPTPVPTATPGPVATPTPTSTAGPKLALSTTEPAGLAPWPVTFNLCGSTDGSGGTNLTYLASFQGGEPLAKQDGCRFSHEYKSNGVTLYNSKLCVEDAAGRQDCQDNYRIKAFVGVKLDVAQDTGCNGTVVATATLMMSGGPGLHAAATVDRVQFEARDVAGNLLGTLDGHQQGSDQWSTGTWKLNNKAKLRVKAKVFAGPVPGDQSLDESRPPC